MGNEAVGKIALVLALHNGTRKMCIVFHPQKSFFERARSIDSNRYNQLLRHSMIFLDGGPTNHKSLLEEHPPGPVSAIREEKCAALSSLYGPRTMLSNKRHIFSLLVIL